MNPRLGGWVRTVWTVFRMHLKQMAVDGFVIFTVIVQPLFVALLAVFMLRGAPGFQAIFVIVGSALTGLWSGTLFFSAFNIEGERWTGNLEPILASPTPLAVVVTSKALANVTLSVVTMLVSYPIAAWLLGLTLTVAHPWLFAFSLAMTIVSLISIGMLISPIMAIGPGTNVWANALEFPMYVVGGFLFSVTLLPGWTTPISYVLAPYWAARALHLSSSGGGALTEIVASWGIQALLSLVYWLVAVWLLRIVLHKARVEATLGLM